MIMKGCIAGFLVLLHDYISQGGKHGSSLQNLRMPNDERLEEIKCQGVEEKIRLKIIRCHKISLEKAPGRFHLEINQEEFIIT